MNLLFEYPSWLILACGGFAFIFAFWLYRSDRLNGHLSLSARIFLGFIRFIALFLLAIFLLHPLLKSVLREVEDPIVVVAIDDSESIASGSDSSYVRGSYRSDIKALVENLSETFEVRTYRFGEQIGEGTDSLTFNQKITDFDPLLDGLYSRYSNRNVGAVIIASDGVYNRGKNPLYDAKKLNAPVYTIALGDTVPKRDLRVVNVASNRLAYLGNKFPIEILVEGREAAGSQTQLTIENNGGIVFSESVSFNEDFQQKTIRTTLEADKSGSQRYRITLKPISNEATTANNVTDVFVDVLQNRQKILILSTAPHPDVAAMAESIRSNENYEVNVALADEYDGKISDYSLAIFVQIPAISGAGDRFISESMDANVPCLFMLGANTSFTSFNNLKLGYSLTGFKGTMSDVHGSFTKGFNNFRVEEDVQRMFRELPPLRVPFGELKSSAGAINLVNQRIGMIDTDLPLVSFNKVKSNNIAIIFGEGLWRWRMINFVKQGSHNRYNTFIAKVVQYMANKEDRRQFRIRAPKSQAENERLLFEAEVYDDTYEAITDPEVTLVITNEEGANFEFTFSRYDRYYKLDAGLLPVGDYSWAAKTTVGGKGQKLDGKFTVYPLQFELAQTTANHKLLNQFAIANGGEMVLPGDMLGLSEMIRNNAEVKSISFERKQLSDLIDVRWLLAFILLLLSTEWLLRKRSGSY